MENESENKNAAGSKVQSETSQETAAQARAARVKKMRGWLSGRSFAAPASFDEEIYYGDGHSGWNR